MARFRFAEATLGLGRAPRWIFAALLALGYALTVVARFALDCEGACLAARSAGAFLTLFIFPYSLFWLLVPAFHNDAIMEALILVVCVVAYLVARRFMPPRLTAPQVALALLGWALLSAMAMLVYLTVFYSYYGFDKLKG